MQLQVIEGLPGANDGDVCSKTDTRLFRPPQIKEADMKCVQKAAVNSPVPKPSIPGISSPKLQRKRLKIHSLLDIISKEAENIHNIPLDALLRRLALELTGLPLFELGWPLAWGGGASADTGGRLDLSFGLKIHFELFCYLRAGSRLQRRSLKSS